MELKIKEVTSKNELKEFIKFPDKLYSGSKYYIPPLHSAEINIFSKEKNSAFEFCNAKYWLVYRNGEVVGRVAGIINHKYNKKQNIKYARFGWLDFIEDKEVPELLLNRVEQWATECNMEYLHGPLGFTSFDASGVLVEGFDEMPTSFAHYNYSYYPGLIEKCGFKKDVDWIEYNIKVPEIVPEKVSKGAELIAKRYKLHTADGKNIKDILKYFNGLFELINVTYKDLYGFTEITPKQAVNLKKQFQSLLSPEYISFVLNEEDELVAFGISMPSLSKALKKSNGKLFPFGYLRVMRALRNNDTIDLLLIAIKPEYQNKGLNAIIFKKIMQTVINNNFTNVETTRELEDNQKVQHLWNDYESRQHKRTRCYIKKLVTTN